MKKGNILIVDDEVLIVNNLKLTLEDYGEEIYTAYNGKEALGVMADHDVHCVICDINMPVMTGVEMIKEMRLRDINVPVIFYTGHGNIALMKEAAKYGAFDFLDKPNLDGLEEVIKNGLEAGFKRDYSSETDRATLETEFSKLLKELGD